ncbi:AraC family transcriptional regulator [Pedobacter duraquae]|uniref:AraC-like protein n=1 Tax=Pedobacter duraquae TaxID=425511 RepID=A0A4R6IGE4_9SPHI|nr:AraC family transcriptional regulator [Pedobacter duraquae]TDO20747.1 AraC-like protein [Pedobacter duraquae]
MDKAAIPRLELTEFAATNFKFPVFSLAVNPLHNHQFTIKNRKDNPVNDYISPNRREFYKIFHATAGTGILTVGLHQYLIGAGDIAFIHPDEIISWQTTSEESDGHFCLIHPDYFDQASYLLQLFKQYPFFKAARAVVQLSDDQSTRVNACFEIILQEADSTHEDKKQAIFLQLQMLLLEVQRAGKNLPEVAVPESYRYIHNFLSLLESAFQIKGQDTVVKIKTAGEFAEQLNVHPNYLNTLVKNQTGKTLREHIQERLLYEAKVLLLHTDWDIRAISRVLGFSEQAAFTSFFHKKEKVSPSLFRETLISA